MKLIVVFILLVLIYVIINKKLCENFDNFEHPDLVLKCFSRDTIDTFKEYYKYSKIVYGSDEKSLCYLTPTKYINGIPILSWNGYYVNNLCVDENFRKQGKASELLKKVIDMSYNDNKDHLILQVKNNDEISKHLFFRNGFIEDSSGEDENGNLMMFLVKRL